MRKRTIDIYIHGATRNGKTVACDMLKEFFESKGCEVKPLGDCDAIRVITYNLFGRLK